MRGPRRPCNRASTFAITPMTKGAPSAIVRTCSSWMTGIGRAALIAQPDDHRRVDPERRPSWGLLPFRLSRPSRVEAISAAAPRGSWRASSPVVAIFPHVIPVRQTGGSICNVCRVANALPGLTSPLGATPRDGGTNFAVASGVAEAVEVCLFDEAGTQTLVQLPDYDDGVWHGFVPSVGPGQAYGYRVHGPWDPGRGLRCNPAKLLLDPYARAVRGQVSFGPEVFDYEWGNADAPSSLDSAGHVPLSLVT